jgi:ribosomal protein S18 acetylase RimI-like enzyme
MIERMLRDATLADLRVVCTWVTSALECELWAGRRVRFPLDLEHLAWGIDFSHHGGLVLMDGAEISGFGQVVPKAAARAHLARIIVAPHRRGMGVGRQLVTSLIDVARQRGRRIVSLNVDPNNAVAIALYTKLGFRDAARPPDEPDPHGSRYMQRPA